MVVCKFFLQGNCRFGNSCRNEHPGNTDNRNQNRFGALQNNDSRKDPSWNINLTDVRNDLTDGKGRPKWILSTYGPGRSAPASLLEGNEFSPEEVRVRFYELASQGKQDEGDQEAIALWTKAEQSMNDVANNADNVVTFMEEAEKKHPNRYDFCQVDGTKPIDQVAKESESQNTTSTGFGTGTGFGQNSSASNPFNKPPTSTFGQPAVSSAFGESPGFGKPAFGQSGFGTSSSQTTTSAFGQPAPTTSFGQAAGANAFGRPSLGGTGFGQTGFGQTSQPTSAFGQPSQPTSAFGQASQPTSTFGQPAQPSSAFGKPAFGASSFGQTSSAFGQPAQTTTAFGQTSQPTSAFGQTNQPTSAFGQPSQPTSAFGQPSQPNSAFGQQKPAPTSLSTAFGQPSQPTSTFGRPSQPVTSAFGQPSNISSAFGQPAQGGSTAFGQTTNAKPFGSTSSPPPFGSNPFITTGFGRTPTPQPSNPFGAQPTAISPVDQSMDTGGSRPISRENPFAQPPGGAASQTTAEPPRTGSLSTAAVLPNTNNSTTPIPLTGRPPRPLHYTQTLPAGPTQTNMSKQLTVYRGRPVKYDNGVPCYQRPDGKGWEKIWFPEAGADPQVVPLNREDKLNDFQGTDDQYTDAVKEQYKYLFDEGRFKNGKIPLVPPMREWCVYDF